MLALKNPVASLYFRSSQIFFSSSGSSSRVLSFDRFRDSPLQFSRYPFSNLKLSRNFVGRGNSKWKMPNQGKGNRVITVSVDGNISSGKSTLVSNLKELFPKDFSFQVELVPEPLEKWTDLQGHNLLGMFYDDPVKNNFMFQHYVQLTRLIETIKKPKEVKGTDLEGSHHGTVRIMERSLQNNRYCFTELARREGRLQPEEFAVLSEWHKWMEEHFDLNLDLIIYLRTSPETVFNRMQQRGREEESSVPLNYLKNLHEAYEDWLVRGKVGNLVPASNSNHVKPNKNSAANQKVIVIDANQGKEEVASQCRNYLTEFMSNNGYQNGTGKTNSSSQKRKHNEIDNDNIVP
ncbi:unnamed protein product [Orchesella dallaii]|uniref:Deoxynucleoside kinase domain-containing protein n=1 Tax=Orchesella dallaii TaxID=48710 RepID=A0ABP1QD53_9HEXA